MTEGRPSFDPMETITSRELTPPPLSAKAQELLLDAGKYTFSSDHRYAGREPDPRDPTKTTIKLGEARSYKLNDSGREKAKAYSDEVAAQSFDAMFQDYDALVALKDGKAPIKGVVKQGEQIPPPTLQEKAVLQSLLSTVTTRIRHVMGEKLTTDEADQLAVDIDTKRKASGITMAEIMQIYRDRARSLEARAESGTPHLAEPELEEPEVTEQEHAPEGNPKEALQADEAHQPAKEPSEPETPITIAPPGAATESKFAGWHPAPESTPDQGVKEPGYDAPTHPYAEPKHKPRGWLSRRRLGAFAVRTTASLGLGWLFKKSGINPDRATSAITPQRTAQEAPPEVRTESTGSGRASPEQTHVQTTAPETPPAKETSLATDKPIPPTETPIAEPTVDATAVAESTKPAELVDYHGDWVGKVKLGRPWTEEEVAENPNRKKEGVTEARVTVTINAKTPDGQHDMSGFAFHPRKPAPEENIGATEHILRGVNTMRFEDGLPETFIHSAFIDTNGQERGGWEPLDFEMFRAKAFGRYEKVAVEEGPEFNGASTPEEAQAYLDSLKGKTCTMEQEGRVTNGEVAFAGRLTPVQVTEFMQKQTDYYAKYNALAEKHGGAESIPLDELGEPVTIIGFLREKFGGRVPLPENDGYYASGKFLLAQGCDKAIGEEKNNPQPRPGDDSPEATQARFYVMLKVV